MLSHGSRPKLWRTWFKSSVKLWRLRTLSSLVLFMFLYHLRSGFVLNLVMLEVFKLFTHCPKSFGFWEHLTMY
jgi:hypothetical protein